MPSITIAVPYLRNSPLYIPRRDLVLAAPDSLFVRLTILDSDRPDALAIVDGYTARLQVWADADGWHNDYGMAHPMTGQLLLDIAGVDAAPVGAFDFSVPAGTASGWPQRCGWCVRLDYPPGGSEVLLSGKIHVSQMAFA